jgi:predicted nucleic acid-binding protein
MEDWRRRRYYRVRLTQAILESAVTLVEKHRLRVYDGIHLASLVALSTMLPDVAMSTWDQELATAALAEGLSLAHEVTN